MSESRGSISMRVEDGVRLHRRGDVRGAILIYRKILERTPKEPVALHFLGLAMLQTGAAGSAEHFLERAVDANTANTNALADLAAAKYRLGKTAAAIALFNRVLETNPQHVDALRNLATALIEQQRFEEAVPLLERLTDVTRGSSRDLQDLARCRQRIGRISEAIAAYEKALEISPSENAARIGLGEACESAGRLKQARLQYLSVLRRDPSSPSAMAKLLRLPDAAPEPELIERAVRCASDSAANSAARSLLHSALAHFFDKRANYDSAFRHLEDGKALQRPIRSHDDVGYSNSVDRLIATFDADYFTRVSGMGVASQKPLFVLGMPRSGTTMMEQILSSHPRVAAGGELSTILTLVSRVGDSSSGRVAYPEGCNTLSAEEIKDFANVYLQRLAEVSKTHQHVTDKLPFNFIHIGFIATLFPNARIIHCARNALDNCLSCYFTEFSAQINFTGDLETLGNYYIEYRRLMNHWRRVLPGRIIDVQYEDMVTDTESGVRHVLDFCGLDWDDACLNFHQTHRDIQTPSRWQVRQPVHSNSVGRWRCYERQLEPLIRRLNAGDAV